MSVSQYNWKNLPVTIVGMGRSAVGAASLLARHGAKPFVTDSADAPAQAAWRAELGQLGVPSEAGGHTERAWASPALVVLSPGVPPSLAPLSELRERGIEVIGELELASRFTEAPIFAVTGTNGKTTVTELLHHLLSSCGYRSRLAGNNHTSFSAAVCDEGELDYYVLEVSSYQLESVKRFAPWVGAILNLTPDHLGRHGTMAGYGAAKARLFGAADRCASFGVLNEDDDRVIALEVPRGTERLGFSLERPVARGLYLEDDILWVDGERWGSLSIPLPGKHNRANVLAALAMMHAGGFDLNRCLVPLSRFPGVEHRLEPLGDVAGRFWYNDSKSTNVDSLRVALESFSAPLTLIAGGQGKGSSYDDLRGLVAARASHFVAFGAEGPTLAAAFEGAVDIAVVSGLDEAVGVARQVSESGETVLLSPGCASFDQYSNFEARGAHFKALVAALNHEEPIS